MNEKMRTFEMGDKKRGVRLDTSTWEAIDLIAKTLEVKWAALARRWAENDPEDAEDNLTAVIRAGAMRALLALQQGGNIATATAVATTVPGILRIDWTSDAARGEFQLDAKSAENLAKTLEIARITAAADALEAWGKRCGPSEEEKEGRRREERVAEDQPGK